MLKETLPRYATWLVEITDSLIKLMFLLPASWGRSSIYSDNLEAAFRTALKQVLMVYPQADVSLVRGGLQLRRSAPPVSKRAGGLLKFSVVFLNGAGKSLVRSL
jgi:hypothetical protein